MNLKEEEEKRKKERKQERKERKKSNIKERKNKREIKKERKKKKRRIKCARNFCGEFLLLVIYKTYHFNNYYLWVFKSDKIKQQCINNTTMIYNNI